MRASSRWWLWGLLWCLHWRAPVSAQAGETEPPVRSSSTAHELPPSVQLLREPGSSIVLPAPEPSVGTCVGVGCEALGFQDRRLALARARARLSLGPTPRRERFAYTGAGLGMATAGLLLTGAVTIAAVDDPSSERVTRGVWLGVTAVSAPLVALSVYLARKQSGFAGYPGLRRFAWLAYGLAVADGAFLYSGAFRGERGPNLLTVAAGVLAALSVLPHALEAAAAGRSLRIRRVKQRLAPSAGGFIYRF